MKNNWTTISGAARMLGLAPMTVYRYIDQGLIDVIINEKRVKLVDPKQVEKARNGKQVGRPKKTIH